MPIAVYLKNCAILGTENGGIVFDVQNQPGDGNLVIVGLLAWKKQFIALCEKQARFLTKVLKIIILIKCNLSGSIGDD